MAFRAFWFTNSNIKTNVPSTSLRKTVLKRLKSRPRECSSLKFSQATTKLLGVKRKSRNEYHLEPVAGLN